MSATLVQKDGVSDTCTEKTVSATLTLVQKNGVSDTCREKTVSATLVQKDSVNRENEDSVVDRRRCS